MKKSAILGGCTTYLLSTMYGFCIWVLELQGLKMGFFYQHSLFLSLHYLSILAHCPLPLISLLESEAKMIRTKFSVL